MFGFDRKEVLKLIDNLIQSHYGTYKELTSLTLQEMYDILKTRKSIEQEDTMLNAGL